MNPENYDLKREELTGKAACKLLSSDTFYLIAHDRLYKYICERAEEIKSEYVVSKQIVFSIYSAQRAIESTAGYNQQSKSNLVMAESSRTCWSQ